MATRLRRRSKVIGYFAFESPTMLVYSGEACVIAGSRRAMTQYILEIDPTQRIRRTIKKTTFAEIKRGLELGAAYAFDKAAYKRFYPLARGAGLDVKAVDASDFEKQAATGERFLIIHLQTL